MSADFAGGRSRRGDISRPVRTDVMMLMIRHHLRSNRTLSTRILAKMADVVEQHHRHQTILIRSNRILSTKILAKIAGVADW